MPRYIYGPGTRGPRKETYSAEYDLSEFTSIMGVHVTCNVHVFVCIESAREREGGGYEQSERGGRGKRRKEKEREKEMNFCCDMYIFIIHVHFFSLLGRLGSASKLPSWFGFHGRATDHTD